MAKRGRPAKQASKTTDLVKTPKLPHQSIKKLEAALEKRDMLDLVLSGVRPSQVAEMKGVSITTVHNAMSQTEQEVSFETREMQERFRYLDIARIERMFSVFFPKMLDGDQRAAELILKAIKLRDDLVTKNQPKTEDPTRTAINIENIELTITAGNPMFQIAQQSMEDDWLGLADTPLSLLYENDPDLPNILTPTAESLSKIEELYGQDFVVERSKQTAED